MPDGYWRGLSFTIMSRQHINRKSYYTVFYENGEYESLLKETLENVYPKAVARFNEKWDGAK